MNTYDNYNNYGNVKQNDCDYDPYADTGVLSRNNDCNYDPYGDTDVLNRGGSDQPTMVSSGSYGNTVDMTHELLRLNTAERFRIDNNSCLVIGRAFQAVHICVNNNPSVSNQHAQINCIGGVCSIVDLQSRNGTFVNDARLLPSVAAILNQGDYVTFGNEIFRFM